MLSHGLLSRAVRTCHPVRIGTAARLASTSVSAEELERKYLVPTYSNDGVRTLNGLVFVRGSGSTLYDQDNNPYIDWAAGIAVNALGHSDPEWVEAVTAQAKKLAHVSNLFHTWEPLQLAKSMVDSSKYFDKVFFCNSGTEANEAALKFARKYALVQAQRKAAGLAATAKPDAFQAFGCKAQVPSACFTKGGQCGCWPQVSNNDVAREMKTEVIAFKHSFHGRSMGALAATHKPQIRQPFGPFPGDVNFARFNNIDDVEKYISKKTAAIIVEPVQGEGGVFPAEKAFMKALRVAADSVGALLIVDEVQCGLGRTGRLWAHEAYDVQPDIMSLAKPLAGGLPIGAVMVTDAVSAAIVAGDHGTTYGGNPFVTSVAQVVFDRIADPAFLASTQVKGRRLLTGLRKLQAQYPAWISAVRGSLDEGLFAGVQLTGAPKPITQAAIKRGLLVITAGDNVLRICPPLTISEADIDFGLKVLDACFKEAPAPAK